MSYSAYFLVGATATGKSGAAQILAERYGWAILSADSMMVYRGMDIGTAKPTVDERGDVPYYGIDIVQPSEQFSVWDFRRHALAALEENREAGREVIVVGGTGLYIKSLTHGLRETPGSDAALRDLWMKRIEQEGLRPLQKFLEERMLAAYRSLADKENPRRLLRLLESGGETTGSREWDSAAGGGRIVGLTMEHTLLHRRIRERVDQMYAAGFAAEVERLLEGGELSPTARQAIGYAEMIDFLAGRKSEEEARERTVIRTRQLAKRQRTWFRHQADAAWVDAGAGASAEEIADRVDMLWREHGPTEISG